MVKRNNLTFKPVSCKVTHLHLTCSSITSFDKIAGKGLQTKKRQSQHHQAEYLTDLDFTDDLALIAECIKDAEALLRCLEEDANAVGL